MAAEEKASMKEKLIEFILNLTNEEAELIVSSLQKES